MCKIHHNESHTGSLVFGFSLSDGLLCTRWFVADPILEGDELLMDELDGGLLFVEILGPALFTLVVAEVGFVDCLSAIKFFLQVVQ